MRVIVIAVLVLILASLASALVFLLRDRGDSTRTVKALTFRIGLSVALFLLLMAGFYLGIIPPEGIR
ncbi:MAG: twin transmembrane helix small protein [Acidiferrobacterales bacterium]